MPKLAVLILTKNEEKNISEAIRNARQCSQEVVIIDSGSTDKTLELAEKAGARVCYRAWDNDFAAQRNFALLQTKAEWVLYLDADERLDEKLVRAIKKIVENGTIDKQYSIVRKSVAFGQKFNHGVLRPDLVTRMFPRNYVFWEGKVHERPVCALKKVKLEGYIIHYTYASWEEYFKKFNQYTTIWSEDAYKMGKRTTVVSAFLHASFALIQVTIFKLGILDGWLGLALCHTQFIYTLIKYLKLYALQKKNKGIFEYNY